MLSTVLRLFSSMRGLSQGLEKASPIPVRSVTVALSTHFASALLVARLLAHPRISRRRRDTWPWPQILRIHTAAAVAMESL
ncbi:hypothetical protein Golax_024680 [Gossypium laxum]|uniref:Uncharacterized protein n=1 Tax=Gossypium laxum TaxID=34288 RepID=A0A7J8ZCT4_9ROSI|nr:hypothetical protein [Gossypium laxum]